MANVSSSNGLEKRPKLRFPGFDEPYILHRIGDIYAERSERGAADMELLSVTMNGGVMQRSEIEGKDNSSEDKSNYKVVRKGDMVYNSMRMWQGANGVSSYDGIVSPAYTVLTAKIPICNEYFAALLGQFTRNYTQTEKRAADNKRRYAPEEGSIPPVLLSGVSKGACPLAHDFAEQSVVCYTLCRRCRENAVAAGEGKGI